MRKLISFGTDDEGEPSTYLPKERRKQKTHRLLSQIGVAIVYLILVIVGVLLGLSLYWREKGEPTAFQRIAHRVAETLASPDYVFGGRDRVNILVVGADRNYNRSGQPLPQPARSDTILVVSLERSGKAGVLSIPRDTVVRVNGHYRKINAVHASGGPQFLQKVLAEKFGIETHYFVQVTFDGFIELVDLLGGVDLFVDHDLHYDDNWGKLHIHLNRGWQHLDGEKAIGYVRYRQGPRKFCKKCRVKIQYWDPSGDLGRMARQQKFLKALLEKIRKENLWARLPALTRMGYRHVATDFSLRSALSLAAHLRRIRFEDIETGVLPGEFTRFNGLGIVLVPDVKASEELLSRILGFTFNPAVWRQGGGPSVRLASSSTVLARAHRKGVKSTAKGLKRTEEETAPTEETVPLVGDMVIVEPAPEENPLKGVMEQEVDESTNPADSTTKMDTRQ